MITSLLDADMDAYDRDMRESMWWMEHPKLMSIQEWFLLRWSVVVDHTLCKWFSHNLVDDGSYATPDSGGEGWMCTRCGRSWWHQYY